MKAVYFMKHGGPEVLEYGDIPDPVAGRDEVIVDVYAASVNGADWKVRAGRADIKTAFPYVLGRDFSGVISSIGEGTRDFAVGDAVFGVIESGREGAYAEKVFIHGARIAKKPENLSHVDAASVALIGLTALWSIEDTLQLVRGETILIQGGAGGVASFAIQVAKHIGARVITTASAANHDYLRKIGADQVIDYNTQDYAEVVSDCDAVYDTVGGEVAKKAFSVLRPGGRAAFIASGPVALPPPNDTVVSLRPIVYRDRKHLERIAELVTCGAVRVPEIQIYPLLEAARAHAVSEGRHLRGKLVFKVR